MKKSIIFTTLLVLSHVLYGDAKSIPKTIEGLRKEIASVLKREKVPGTGIALVNREGIIWAGGVGKSDVAKNKDVTADTHFRVGSISKSFIASTLAILSQQGRIDLNAKVRDVIPEIQIENRWEQTKPLRISYVLEHTAGFDDMHFNEAYNLHDPPDIGMKQVLSINPHSRIVRWPPGTRWSYANPGYAVAGYLIEKVTGRHFEDAVRDMVLLPVGMPTASFRLTRTSENLLSQGYSDAKFKPVPYHFIYLRPAGSLNCSPKELGLFVQMLLNRGKANGKQIISPEMIDRMEHPQTTDAVRAGLKDGYGLAIFAGLDRNRVTFGHDGGIDGFISQYVYLPKEGIGYVLLLNSTHSGKAFDEITALLFEYLTRELPNPVLPRMKLPAESLRKLEGYYEDQAPRNQILAFLNYVAGGKQVFLQGGRLYQKEFLKQSEELIPVGQNMFRTNKQPEASMVFITGNSMILAGAMSFHVRTNIWPWRLMLAILIACNVLMVSALLFFPVWGFRKLFGRMREVKHLRVRVIPLLAVLSLISAEILLTTSQLFQLGDFNLHTGGFFALTIIFALLSIWGLILSIRSFQWEMNRAARIHSLLVSMANCAIVVFLGYWHMIGLRLWAF